MSTRTNYNTRAEQKQRAISYNENQNVLANYLSHCMLSASINKCVEPVATKCQYNDKATWKETIVVAVLGSGAGGKLFK